MELEARALGFRYTAKAPWIVKDVSFTVAQGERLGVTAPSGYGKTTLMRLLAGYESPVTGSVLLNGAPLPGKGFCPVQLIAQHPEQAINPRWKLRKVLAEAGPYQQETLSAMGIEAAWLDRYPRELSGGELQRFCVARALRPQTRILIADEMSTMLDVITQAQIWQYLLAETARRKISMVVVTHNPALAARVCTRVIELEAVNRAAADVAREAQ